MHKTESLKLYLRTTRNILEDVYADKQDEKDLLRAFATLTQPVNGNTIAG